MDYAMDVDQDFNFSALLLNEDPVPTAEGNMNQDFDPTAPKDDSPSGL